MDDEEEPAQNPVCRQGMRERRTYLRRPFQPQEGACHHAAGRIIFERRRVTGSIPEGARTFTGHMGYFKRGAFQLADELQLEVVPVTIDGSFEILPRTGKWIHRHRMILTIHEPIPPRKGAENIKASMNEAYAAVESALPEKYKGMVKNEDQDR